MRKTRLACALTAVLLLCFLIGHGIAGSVYIRVHFEAALHWMAWLGPVVAAAHIIACANESVCMMTDKVNPPSSRKKRHMAKKWATGVLVVAVLVAHIANPSSMTTFALLAIVLWHSLVGAKSLVRDFRLSRSFITPVRGIFVAVVVILACLFAWGLALL